MTEPTELRGEENKIYRLIKVFRDESKAVTIAGISLVVAILSLLMAFMALNDAKEADIRSQLLLENLRETKEEVEVYEVYISNLHAELRAHGFEPPPLPEEE